MLAPRQLRLINLLPPLISDILPQALASQACCVEVRPALVFRLVLESFWSRVLIVDGSMANRKLLNRKLITGEFKELQWKVETAKTGETCLEMIDAGGVFDLIVVDDNMQDAGGELLETEATELIRKREDGGGTGR